MTAIAKTAMPEESMKSSKTKKRALHVIITIVLLIYALITITPFYMLLVRSFVPTKQSNTFHFWIPAAEEVNMKAKYGNLGTYYSLDLASFREFLNEHRTVEEPIKYINTNLTLAQISEKYGVDPQVIKDYLKPIIRFNGFYAVTNAGFFRSVGNSLIITGGTICLGGLLSIMTASVLAKFRKKWHRRIYNLYLCSMIIPTTVTMLPCFIIINKLGLYDHHLALILLGAQGGAVPIMIFTAYIATIPNELYESVQIDGGTRMSYFLYILLPNMATPFASYVAITLPNVWNNMLNGVLYLSQEKQPITSLISSLAGTYATNYQAMYSGLFMSMLPLLIVYLLFQDLFVQSAMLGAVKG